MITSIKEIKTSNYKKKARLGRGIGSGIGKTSGRGVKGQKARTGHHSVRGFEGGQTPIHMRLPKKGFKTNSKNKFKEVSSDKILMLYENGKIRDNISKHDLVKVGVLKNEEYSVKIIMGKVNSPNLAKIKVKADAYSEKAKIFK